jgi:two-component system response regulator
MPAVRKILLVEDNADHVELIMQAALGLEIECQFDVVSDGTKAIEYLFNLDKKEGKESAQIPDLILLDLKMPKMSGLQVLHILRSTRHSNKFSLPPIVVLSSSSQDNDIREAYELGVYSYLIKPVDAEQFNSTVTKAISYWLELNEPNHGEELNRHGLSFPH